MICSSTWNMMINEIVNVRSRLIVSLKTLSIRLIPTTIGKRETQNMEWMITNDHNHKMIINKLIIKDNNKLNRECWWKIDERQRANEILGIIHPHCETKVQNIFFVGLDNIPCVKRPFLELKSRPSSIASPTIHSWLYSFNPNCSWIK